VGLRDSIEIQKLEPDLIGITCDIASIKSVTNIVGEIRKSLALLLKQNFLIYELNFQKLEYNFGICNIKLQTIKKIK